MKKPAPLPVEFIKGTILNSATRLEALARESTWLKRRAKKLGPVEFVHGLLAAALGGDCALRGLACSIGMRLTGTAGGSGTISKPALWERIGPAAVLFLQSVLAELVRETVLAGRNTVPSIEGVERILVEDSAALALHPDLAGECPANGNQHGEGAALRLQAAFDLLTGRAERLGVHAYKRNDQAAAGDIVDQLRPGDLLVRDLGYFALGSLAAIAGKGAHYLSRHFPGCVVSHPPEKKGDGAAPEAGGRVDLLEHLEKHAPRTGDVVDMDVVLGTGQKGTPRPAARLVARRVPAVVEEKRLRRLNAQGRQRGRQHSKATRRLQAWEIYVTSLSEEQAPAGKILQLYPLRWRIEIIFKACKSHTALNAIAGHRSNVHHVEVLLNAWVCGLVLATRTGAFALALPPDGTGKGLRPNYLSLLKVVPKVIDLLASLLRASAAPPEEFLRRWGLQIAYHDRYEARKDRTNMAAACARTLGSDSLEPGLKSAEWLP